MRTTTVLSLFAAGLLLAPVAAGQTPGLRKPALPLLPHLMRPAPDSIPPSPSAPALPTPPIAPAPPSPEAVRTAVAVDPGILILPDSSVDARSVWLHPERPVDPAMLLSRPPAPPAERLAPPPLPEPAPAPRRVPMQRQKQ